MAPSMPVEFESLHFVILDATNVIPRHANYPRGACHIINPKTGRPAVSGLYWDQEDPFRVEAVVVHQTNGSYDPGFKGLLNTAHFFVRDPAWEALPDDRGFKWTGRGRGWPGFGYTWYVPHVPEITTSGKYIIYQTNDLKTVSWHTRGLNHRSGGIAFQGRFFEDGMHNFRPYPGENGSPSDAQMCIFEGFVNDYMVNILKLDPSTALLGHYHTGKLTCPGKVLRTAVERVRGAPRDIDLSSWRLRQAAMLIHGHYLGTTGRLRNGVDGDPGELTRLAIEACEDEFMLAVNGEWDARLENNILKSLRDKGVTQSDLEELIG